MEIQKEIKELREKLESLEKQLSSKHEFAKGWHWADLNQNTGYLAYFDDCSKDRFGHLKAKYYTSNSKFFNEGAFTKIDRPAAPEEIKDALVKVCEKMGIKEGVTVNRPECFTDSSGGALDESEVRLTGRAFTYYQGLDLLQINGRGVYQKGQFATVVKEEEIKIGGYKCEWIKDKSILKVGCKEIPYRWVADLRGSMQNFKINHVTIEHEEIELETIVKILNLRDK